MSEQTDNRPLAGQLGLVTGASRGIGEATALALAEAGMHVVLTARDDRALEAVEEGLADQIINLPSKAGFPSGIHISKTPFIIQYAEHIWHDAPFQAEFAFTVWHRGRDAPRA